MLGLSVAAHGSLESASFVRCMLKKCGVRLVKQSRAGRPDQLLALHAGPRALQTNALLYAGAVALFNALNREERRTGEALSGIIIEGNPQPASL